MKLLWVNSSFLHPTNRGGQIRTLEMLRQLHRRHEIHYAALADPDYPEGPARAGEYSTRSFPVRFEPVSKRSPQFALQLAGGLFSSLPLAIGRWQSAELRSTVERLLATERYDAVVCDFLVTAVNFPALERAVLFQHNVETVIWQRHADTASSWLKQQFLRLQESRMRAFESEATRKAAKVIAVSEKDAATMRELFGVESDAVATGVDTDYFRPPVGTSEGEGLVFVGSMDWLPNIDGILWFTKEVLPLIRARRKQLPVTIVGRKPPREIEQLAAADPYLKVTGTVPDVRPYLWGAAVSVVPLRVGGGTRLKIYEAMAAGTPLVSTAVGAEGLDVVDGETIALADSPETFAQRCLELLEDTDARHKMRSKAMAMVAERYGWDQVTRHFERLLFSGTQGDVPASQIPQSVHE
ncbi:MAG: glycosyltransferase [Acidobacteriota bacterium]